MKPIFRIIIGSLILFCVESVVATKQTVIRPSSPVPEDKLHLSLLKLTADTMLFNKLAGQIGASNISSELKKLSENLSGIAFQDVKTHRIRHLELYKKIINRIDKDEPLCEYSPDFKLPFSPEQAINANEQLAINNLKLRCNHLLFKHLADTKSTPFKLCEQLYVLLGRETRWALAHLQNHFYRHQMLCNLIMCRFNEDEAGHSGSPWLLEYAAMSNHVSLTKLLLASTSFPEDLITGIHSLVDSRRTSGCLYTKEEVSINDQLTKLLNKELLLLEKRKEDTKHLLRNMLSKNKQTLVMKKQGTSCPEHPHQHNFELKLSKTFY